MRSRGSWTLFHFRKIPIRAHWSLLLMLPYLAWVFSVQFQDVARVAGVDGARLVLPPLVWGALLAVALFASVAVHEMAHTALAMRFGGRVRSITLTLLGGVSSVSRLPARPLHEAVMALAGPITSLALGMLFLVLRSIAAGGPDDVSMGLFYLGSMNLLLGLFNLVPAFPMDGGRVLRAALSGPFGAGRATQVSAAVGRVLAVVMGLIGAGSGNFLLLLIAVFIYFGAGAEQRSQRVRQAMVGLKVADLLPHSNRGAPSISRAAAVSEVLPLMRESGRMELVIAGADGSPLAVVGAADVSGLRSLDPKSMPVAELIPRLEKHFLVASPDSSVSGLLELSTEQDAPYIVVVDPSLPTPQSTVALLAPSDLERLIALRLMEHEASGAPEGLAQHTEQRAQSIPGRQTQLPGGV